jgi:hypothetical protein
MKWVQKPDKKTEGNITLGYCKVDLCPFCIIKICWESKY